MWPMYGTYIATLLGLALIIESLFPKHISCCLFCNLMLVVNLQLQKNISMLSAEQYLLGMITVT
jgi:hypothetical protein